MPCSLASRLKAPILAAKPIGGERDLWLLWQDRRLPADLRTRDGRALRILFPGLANTGAGPDFTGALLAFDDGAVQRGDVELHLKASSWEGHGHHLDPKYAGVILHVVLLDDGGPARTLTDAVVPVLALGPLLDAAAEPSYRSGAAGPCMQPDAPRPTAERALTAIRAAGQARFTMRAQFWEGEFAAHNLEHCVLQALLRAAGLGSNAEACAALARSLDGPTFEALLSGTEEQRRTVASAVLLGMAGLLEQARAGDDLRETWTRHSDYWPGRPLDARQWRRFRLRPANLPEVRLQALAAMLAADGLEGFLEAISALVDRQPAPRTGELLAPLMPDGTAIGRSWALEAWTNVLLPLLAGAGQAQGSATLTERAERLYTTLPGGGDNRVLERMRAIAGLQEMPRRACEQQGLLHIWSRYCSEQRCAECPLTPGFEHIPTAEDPRR